MKEQPPRSACDLSVPQLKEKVRPPASAELTPNQQGLPKDGAQSQPRAPLSFWEHAGSIKIALLSLSATRWRHRLQQHVPSKLKGD